MSLTDRLFDRIRKNGKKIAAAAAVAAVLGSVLGIAAGEETEPAETDEIGCSAVIETAGLPEEYCVAEKTETEIRLKPGRRKRGLLGNIVYALGWLAAKLLSPFITPLIRFLILALSAFAAVVLGLKLIFPDLSLKKLLSRKSIITIFAVMAAAFVILRAVTRLWPETAPYIRIAELILGIAYVSMIIYRLSALVLKAKRKTAELIWRAKGWTS